MINAKRLFQIVKTSTRPLASISLFFCFGIAQIAEAEGAVMSNRATSDTERLIAFTLTQACSGARGEINWNDVVRADVNADGRQDVVIDHIKIRCFGTTGGMSSYCGMSGNCEVSVYLKEEFGWRFP